MSLLLKSRKHRKPKYVINFSLLPESKVIGGLRYIKHGITYRSKVEANHKVDKLKEQGRIARKVKTKEGYAIYSKGK